MIEVVREIEVIFLMSVMVVLAITDIKKRELPNKVLIPAIVVAVLLQVITLNIINVVIGLVTYIILFILYMINKKIIGGGDIKLLCLMSLILGPMMREVLTIAVGYTMILIAYYFVKEKMTGKEQIVPLAVSLLASVLTNFIGGVI